MSKKNNYSDDPVLQWAIEVAAEYSAKENDLHPQFIRLIEEYRHLLRSFDQVTRISDSYHIALKKSNESLHQTARKDPLTGLANRREMMERLTEEAERADRYGEPMSTILIDIDHFKRVNDTYGHGVGDQVLIATAQCLNNGIRASDICARWGGEEFLICLPHTRIDDAVNVAEKLRLIVAGNDSGCDVGKVEITISAGVAQYEAGTHVDDLIREADDSLYEAKRLGRNRVATAH